MLHVLRKGCAVGSLLVAVSIVPACSPSQVAAIAVSRHAFGAADSVRQVALERLAEVATRHGLDRFTQAHDSSIWWQCYWEKSFRVCMYESVEEIEFVFVDGGFKWSAFAIAVREDLEQNMRSTFGENNVRECELTSLADPPYHVCDPPTAADGQRPEHN